MKSHLLLVIIFLAQVFHAASEDADFKDFEYLELAQTCAKIGQLTTEITPEVIVLGPITVDIERVRNAKSVRIYLNGPTYQVLLNTESTTWNSVFETDLKHLNVAICMAMHLGEIVAKVQRRSDNDDPWQQVLDRLGIDVPWEDLLDSLCARAPWDHLLGRLCTDVRTE